MLIQRPMFNNWQITLIIETGDTALKLTTALEWVETRRSLIHFPIYLTTKPLNVPLEVDMANHVFIRYRLDETQKQDCLVWSDNESEELTTLIAETVADGNKLSLAFDGENGMYLATLSNNRPGSKNRQKSITSRAPTLIQAISVALFKEFVIFQRGEWQNHSAVDDWG